MSNNTKELRGQLRQIAKELLTEELVKAIAEQLEKRIDTRLKAIDDKQKDIISYMVRNSVKKD